MELIEKIIATILAIFAKPVRSGEKREAQKGEKKFEIVEKEEPKKEVKEEVFPKGKTKRVEEEIKDLEKKNPQLYKILIAFTEKVKKDYNKKVVVTMIDRTPEEQDYLYRNSVKYKVKKFKSPHQFWHAFDLRVWLYTEEERKALVKWFNKTYNKPNYYRWTAKIHKVGKGALHFHVQFWPK